MESVITALFPTQQAFNIIRYEGTGGNIEEKIPEMTRHKVIEAGERIRLRKAPGPDGIPSEASKTIFKKIPEVVAKVTKIIRTGKISDAWKKEEMVMIPNWLVLAGTAPWDIKVDERRSI